MLQSDTGAKGNSPPPRSGWYKLDLSVQFNEPRRRRSHIWWVQSSGWTSPALVTIHISLGAKTRSNSVPTASLALGLWTLLQINQGIIDALNLTRCWRGHPVGQLNGNESRSLDFCPLLICWGKCSSPQGTCPLNLEKNNLLHMLHSGEQEKAIVAGLWSFYSNSPTPLAQVQVAWRWMSPAEFLDVPSRLCNLFVSQSLSHCGHASVEIRKPTGTRLKLWPNEVSIQL